jgi:hypothetical protein
MTPECFLEWMRALGVPLWIAPRPNCSSEVWKILQKFKLGNTGRFGGYPGRLPRNVWKALIHQYNPGQQGVTPKNGHDYGNPRGPNDLMFQLMWLSLPQSQPKESVTHKIIFLGCAANGASSQPEGCD